MWADPDDDPRQALSTPVGEKETLWNYLEHYRLTLEMKCEGLDAEPDADFDGAVADPAVVEGAWESWRREVRDAGDWRTPAT